MTRVFPFLSGISLRPGDARFVLERNVHAHAVARHLAVLDRDVEAVSVGNTQVPQGLCGGLDRVAGSCLSRFGADTNQLGYAIDALSHPRAPLLIDPDARLLQAGTPRCSQSFEKMRPVERSLNRERR